MKTRPILFSGPMVRALLNGTKTQTRRVVKPSPEQDQALQMVVGSSGLHYVMDQTPIAYPETRRMRWDCPYGQPADRIWVREAWRTVAEADATPPRDLNEAHRLWMEVDAPHQPGFGKYRPPMFMPRWASRITLEITSVRVERLQDISEEDARAEGANPIPDPCDHARRACAEIGCSGPLPYSVGFASLWQNINGLDSWAANPWVWVVEFKRVKGGNQ